MQAESERAARPAQDESHFAPMLAPDAGACPWLGIYSDPTVMLTEASDAHRCYAVSPEREPRLDYQMNYCLGAGHVRCATFQAARQRTPPVAAPRGRARVQSRGKGPQWFLIGAATVLAVGVIAVVVAVGVPGRREAREPGAVFSAQTAQTVQAETAQAEATALALQNEPAAVTPTPALSPSPEPPAASVAVLLPTPTPRVGAGGAIAPAASGAADANVAIASAEMVAATPTPLAIKPMGDEVGWWRSGDSGEYELADSFLNVGRLDGDDYVSALRLPLSSVPRGAPLLAGWLELSGLNADRLDPNVAASWLVQLVGERQLASLGAATFMMVFSAPNSITLPVLHPGDLTADGANRLTLDANALRWLEEQRLAGAQSVTVRIVAQVDGAGDSLYAWDSGVGPISRGRAPMLWLQAGAAPPTPPPVPTEDLLVATFTPPPQNVVTLVAQQMTATYVAETVGTYTPEPPFVTPTPYARSLATVEAIARNLGLPAVVVETPVPANSATATAVALYATAVALTTGTYTPVPTPYVTPMLVVGPPPSGDEQEDERVLVQVLEGTPLPYNAVIAQWVAATPTPQNVATAAAMVLQATADAARHGLATETPWGVLVYTPVPPPAPTATPTLPLVQDVAAFTPTPVIEPTAPPPAVLPVDLRNRVLFLSDRYGGQDTLAYDPATGSTARINAPWAMGLAAKQLAVSPDGQSVAIVKADDRGILQIHVRSLVYGNDTQITNFTQQGDETRSYDPAWSPTGQWIAFVSTNTGNDEIYRVSTDGAVVEQLTFNSWEWDKHPSWSPDGSRIVFYSNRDTSRRQIWVMNADGSNQQLLTQSDGNDWDPVWTR